MLYEKIYHCIKREKGKKKKVGAIVCLLYLLLKIKSNNKAMKKTAFFMVPFCVFVIFAFGLCTQNTSFGLSWHPLTKIFINIEKCSYGGWSLKQPYVTLFFKGRFWEGK